MVFINSIDPQDIDSRVWGLEIPVYEARKKQAGGTLHTKQILLALQFFLSKLFQEIVRYTTGMQ